MHRDTLKVRKMDAGLNLAFEYLILELAGKSIMSIIYLLPNSSIPTFPGRVHRFSISPTEQIYGPPNPRRL